MAKKSTPSKTTQLPVPVEMIERRIFLIRQLTRQESDSLRSQIATLKTARGQHRKYLPLAFTEQGVAMLSSVLRSERAVQVNIAIMRAFVRLREILATHKDLARKMADLERKQRKHGKQIGEIFAYVQKLLKPPKPPKLPKRRPIGFQPPKK